jgi:hypothetical protein
MINEFIVQISRLIILKAIMTYGIDDTGNVI